MADFLEELKTLFFEHWAWAAIGIGIFFLLALAITIRRKKRLEEESDGQEPPLQWYNKNRWARRLLVNVVGIALILWAAQIFSTWV